jgi:glutaminyl-peptide cyclotransferase
MMIRAPLAALLAILAACGGPATTAQIPQPQPQAQARAGAPAAEPQIYDARIVHVYPHDTSAFTEGLFYLNGQLYESTGLVGRSTIRRVRLEDGHVLQSVSIPPGPFGEGIVNVGDQIVSLTWQGGVGYRWDRRSLRRLGEWHYPGEGWALTRNATDLIMSDGTPQLRFLDPATLAERRRLDVTIRGAPLERLNELEWVDGAILANVWLTGFIVRIDPASGHVTGVIDLKALADQNVGDGDNVLNGIAWDAAHRRLFVTGKNWPHLYEIALVPRAAARR